VQRGAALVEFALVSGLLMALLFGIVEMGLIFKDQATLGQAAREAVRSASLGSPTNVVVSRAQTAASGISLPVGSMLLEKSADSGGSWIALGDTSASPAANNANAGNFVRATITYDHPLVTTLIFPGSVKTLTARLVMRRE
jgi:Flp pilus assembly protein TadG